MTDLGCPPHSNDRIQQMCRRAACPPRADDSSPEGRDAREIYLEAVRDLHLLDFIFRACSQSPRPAWTPAARELSRLRGDHTVPSASDRHTAARDAQFELFIAAAAERSGLTPVTRAEPDLHLNDQHGSVGVAVKRIKSLGCLEDRITEGADQVLRSQLPGILVCDISRALNPNNDRVAHIVSDTTMHLAIDEMFTAWFARYGPSLARWTSRRWVLGVIVMDLHVRPTIAGPWQLASAWQYMSTSTDNAGRNKRFLSLAERLGRSFDE